jgi:hypothetical protein
MKQPHRSNRAHPFICLLLIALLSVGLVALSSTAWAHKDEAHHPPPHAEHDLAKASQNPVSSLISVPFENNYNVDAGPHDKVQNVMNIKPVIPVSLNKDWNLINRVILPVISQPRGFEGRRNGLGDTTYQAFFTPAKTSKWIVGAGPQLQIPTHTNDSLGTQKWGAGPAAVVLTMPGHWVTGLLASQMWDFGGPSDEPDINLTVLQPFANYNIGKTGWYLSSAPVITANWDAKSGDEWTVPLGGGVGKIMHWGKQAVNLKLAGYGNVVRPTHGANYNIQLSLTFMFPKGK